MFLVPVSRRTPVLSRSFNSVFDDAVFNRFFNAVTQTPPADTRSPALDVRETEQAYTVTLDLPGVSKTDVKVKIEGRKVELSAEVAKAAEQKEGERVIYSERAVTSFARSFTLPAELDQATSTAALENGVLTLTLTKKLPASTQIEIQ